MKLGIIGAGFTGLSAAYKLTNDNHDVTVFEMESDPGGLAIGVKDKNWEWTLEKHYHHWFTNDKSVLSLADKINHKVIIKRPKTSILVDGKVYQFDSPKEVVLFPKLSIISRIRMGLVIGLLKINPFWKPLEKINASKFLPLTIGNESYKLIWQPLFNNKFGKYANNISLSWFWARITKRTSSLAYPEGGYLKFAYHLKEEIEGRNGIIKLNTEVISIKKGSKITVTVREKGKLKKYTFDKVIFTLPSFLISDIVKDLPSTYKNKMKSLHTLGATNLVLKMNKPFFKDKTYWVSVCDNNSPIMAIVEHTNFMNKKHYNNEHLVYLGNYLENNSSKYKMTNNELLKLFDPYLKKVNPNYKKHLISYNLYKNPYAQPIIPTNYSINIPSMNTPIKNLYLANIDQVYPWDRGTNYAVELGEKIVDHILNEH